MSDADIALLRLYLADPAGANEVFTNAKLALLLDQNEDDVYAAAADGWRVKAANVSEWYMVNVDGAFLNREQVWEHCIKMAEHYEKIGGGGLANIPLDAGFEQADDESEFT